MSTVCDECSNSNLFKVHKITLLTNYLGDVNTKKLQTFSKHEQWEILEQKLQEVNFERSTFPSLNSKSLKITRKLNRFCFSLNEW